MALKKVFFLLPLPSPHPILAKQRSPAAVLTSEGCAGVMVGGELFCLTSATKNLGIHPLVLLTLNLRNSVNNCEVMNF